VGRWILYAIGLHILLTGLLGMLLNQGHLITLLMFIELTFVIVALLFTVVAVSFGGLEGFLFTYVLLVVAGVEAALSLSIVVNYFFVEGQISTDFVSKLKG